MSFPRKRESTLSTVILDSCFHRNDKLRYVLVKGALASKFGAFSLDNTVFAVYYPTVEAKKHSLAAGKSVVNHRYAYIVQPMMSRNF